MVLAAAKPRARGVPAAFCAVAAFCALVVALAPIASSAPAPALDTLAFAWQSKQGHNAMSVGVAWSPDGKLVANSYYDSRVIIWNAADGAVSANLSVARDQMKYFASQRGFQKSCSALGGATPSCDWPSDTENSTYLPIRAVSWSPDGKYLACGGDDTNITVYDATSWAVHKVLRSHQGSVLTVDWSPDGKRLASGSGTDNIDPHNILTPENCIKIWNCTSWSLEATLAGPKDSVQCVRWSPDGKTLASVADNSDKVVRLWRAGDWANFRNMTGHTLGTLAVDWSPGGEFVASGSRDFTIRIWNAQNGTLKTLLRSNNCIRSLDYHPSGQFLAASGPAESVLAVWNVTDGSKREFMESDPARSTVYCCRWSADGSMLAASSGKEHVLRMYMFGTAGAGGGDGALPAWVPGTAAFLAAIVGISLLILYIGGKDWWRKW